MKRGHGDGHKCWKGEERCDAYTARKEKQLGQIPQIQEIHPSRNLCVTFPV